MTYRIVDEVLYKCKLIARMLPRYLFTNLRCQIGRPLRQAGRLLRGLRRLQLYAFGRSWPRRLARLVLVCRHRRPAAQASNTENVYYPLPNQVLLTMAKILNHYWEDEFKAYYDSAPEDRDFHIYKDIQSVLYWLVFEDVPECCCCLPIRRIHP